MSKRERITREILAHVGEIVAGGELDVSKFSRELRDFLRPLTVREVKSVVLAASRTDAEFWRQFGASLEMLLSGAAAKTPAAGGDETGLAGLVGNAVGEARRNLDERIHHGLRALRRDDAA